MTFYYYILSRARDGFYSHSFHFLYFIFRTLCVCVCMIYMSTCNRHICRWCGIESCVELSLSKPIFLDRYECYSCFSSTITKTKTKTQIQNAKWKYIRIKSNVSCAYVMRRMATTTTIWIVSLQFSLLDVFFLLSFFNLFIFNLLYELCGCCAFVSWLVGCLVCPFFMLARKHRCLLLIRQAPHKKKTNEHSAIVNILQIPLKHCWTWTTVI